MKVQIPAITVLMPVYNGGPHLRASIESILSQSHRDFEFLIVDDGSTDESAAVVGSYTDPRIRLISMGTNSGLSRALNEGLRQAAAPLIARQDADDLSEPARLSRQLAYMLVNPAIGLLGTQATAVSSEGTPTGTVRRCQAPESIRWFSMFDNPFIHTSVMFRTNAAREAGGFNPAYDPFSQDYDLWCRIMEHHPAANLPDTLVRYRVTETSITGALSADGASLDYQRRFARIVSELAARQTRCVLGGEAVVDSEIPLLAGLAVGLEAAVLPTFLALFERLLAAYCLRTTACHSEDFRRTVAGQFDALAIRVKPVTRRSAFAISQHVARHHADFLTSMSWPRMLALLLLGSAGRERLARWKRRQPALAKN